jgi:hypothetical protein
LRDHLKCKGQNNENKRYFKLTKDTKKKPFKKKTYTPNPKETKGQLAQNKTEPNPKINK